eukprot:gnl/TRDRNA2_/TRDRNA2_80228_c0_seq1.p1 gnl/TRDRNA2_/TRDRNA2_80228_c0~~gnl/TRDRNA2_/TRDRNA2_80228_c0_seq1.p1  ORF type:complete len:618 (+),score=131.12 gnl/TRDRNA2_/TRDRNA2_80228_c0_seq1:46-1899(+)
MSLRTLILAGWLAQAWAKGQRNMGAGIKKLMEDGYRGYDLIDKLDVWHGDAGAPYEAPVRVLDALGKADGKAKLSDWTAGGLPGDHFKYFDKNHDGVLDQHEAYSWWFQRQPARTMNLSEVNDPPLGHRKKLGSWKKPLSTEGLIYHKPYPHPREFWSKHMDGYLPAVLKGAQHGWPAMNWTKEVLAKRFGHFDAKLEPKVEARGNDTAYRDLDSHSSHHRLTIQDYLETEEGKNMYVVSIIPQEMAWEVAHPAVLLCGSRSVYLNKREKPPYKIAKHAYPNEFGYSWMTQLFEANLWMGTGRTRSQLHYDKEWNVNCLLKGKKRWFFLNPFWYDEDIQWQRGHKFRKDNPLNNRWTDWIFLEPDEVDLIVQHKLRKMDYYELIQEEGDCIFIPYAMLHQVEKLDEDFQVAASWMFLPETVYTEQDCQGAPLDGDIPLAAMDVLYAYTGKGVIPQGYKDPLDFVRGTREAMLRNNEEYLSFKTFKALVTQGDAILKRKPNKIKPLFDLMKTFAKDPQKGLTKGELMSVPLRVWCKPAAEGDEEGPLPCDVGQEYEIIDESESKRMKDWIVKHIAAQPKRSQLPPPPEGHERPPQHRRVYPGLPHSLKGGDVTGRQDL